MKNYMKEAVKEALIGVEAGHGGPFGAVVVKGDKIIAKGHNCVVSSHDPTAHAEVVAIREASKILKTFDLSECILYTTCEPCPMCYSAVHWSRIKKVIYGATREDAAAVGFDDSLLYDILAGKAQPVVNISQDEREQAMKAFESFKDKEDKVIY